MGFDVGAACRNRTDDLRITSASLWPTELRRQRRPSVRDPLPPGTSGFRYPPVPWLSPGQLAGTALRVLLSDWFGAYLDKRELQQALPDTIFDEGADEAELWFDYVADLGDGFDPTYTVAYLLAQPELSVD